jgi:hypothetical protein
MVLAIGIVIMLGSCTENQRVKQWGGEGLYNIFESK